MGISNSDSLVWFWVRDNRIYFCIRIVGFTQGSRHEAEHLVQYYVVFFLVRSRGM